MQAIQYRARSDLAFMSLIKSQHLDDPIDLDVLIWYSLNPVPRRLGTADSFFNKMNKAAMLYYLMEDAPEEVPYPTARLYIRGRIV